LRSLQAYALTASVNLRFLQAFALTAKIR